MPHSSGDEDDLTSLLEAVTNARAEQINTCMPGVVVSYDHTTQTARVRPALQRPMLDDQGATVVVPVADIPACPVVFPRGGDYILHIPLKAGDGVLLVFSQWPFGEWRRLGGSQVDPGLKAHHHIGSAIAIAGLFPSSAAIGGLSATDVLLGKVGGPSVAIATSGVAIQGATGEGLHPAATKGDHVKVTINAATLAGLLANVTTGAITLVAGDIEVDGEITTGAPHVSISRPAV